MFKRIAFMSIMGLTLMSHLSAMAAKPLSDAQIKKIMIHKPLLGSFFR